MRLRTNIFIWVFLSTIVPLTVLALGATYYSEYTYQREVKREVITSLQNLAAGIERNLRNNRELSLGISRAPAIQALLPALADLKTGESPPSLTPLRQQANTYFEGFQTIFPGAFFLRVLDAQGNALIKVSHNKRSEPVYDSLAGIRYVEQEINAPEFANMLAQLPANEVSNLALPHDRRKERLQNTFALLDNVVPLYFKGEWVGALAVTLVGSQLDRIMDHAVRLYKGQLLIVENNPDNPRTHGQLLYDKSQNMNFAQVRPRPLRLQEIYGPQLLETPEDLPDGVLFDQHGQIHTYYVEMPPYPNRLLTWNIASRIESQVISAPFARIRLSIWAIAASALVVTLLLTDVGARKIARPICQLAKRLTAYADGDHAQRVKQQQRVSEIRELAASFNYMADTLETARQERDDAQHMVLQSNKLASIGQMAAGIGHEINNPLNNILSYAKLASRSLEHNCAKQANPESYQRLLADLDAIRSETLRASEIIKGLLNFARQVPPQYSCFNVDEWLLQTMALVRQSANERQSQLVLENDYPGDLHGDRGQLQQALINLLLNAIQAGPPNSHISLHAWADAASLHIEIRDQGPGIGADELDRIFDPFFSTKAEGEGSGLGLSISLGIIERHQGILEINNHSEGGVAANIRLPLNPSTSHVC